MNDPDLVFVGSGVNSLVGAALAARAGAKVAVFERQAHLGGNVLTAELTEPGFLHDVYSGFHPLFLGSPAYPHLKDDLAAEGLVYRNTDHPTAAVLPDHRAAVLFTDRERNEAAFDAALDGDGGRYRRAMGRFEEMARLGFGALAEELWPSGGAKILGGQAWDDGGLEPTLSRFSLLLEPARAWLEDTFAAPAHRALLAPWVLHLGLGPDDAASAFVDQIIVASTEQGGMPVPEGGGARLVDALVARIEAFGGRLYPESDVGAVIVDGGEARGVRLADGTEVRAGRAVICNVTPTQLYGRLLPAEAIPAEIAAQARRFRYGRANMQLHLALSEAPRWRGPHAEALGRTALVHVTDGLDGVSRAVNEAVRGLLPARATVVVGQHCALDPTRAPDGSATLWIQLQELPREPLGDAAGELDVRGGWGERDLAERYADRIQARLGEHIENLDDALTGRAIVSPSDLERANCNLVGGDPYSGACQLDQFLLWRPLRGLRRHHTPVERLHHIGASTHPGPGLHGTSGYLVARELGYVD